VLVNVTWVFFRAQDFATAWRILRSMLFLHRTGEPILNTYLVVTASATILIMLVIHWLMRERNLHQVAARMPAAVVGLIWGAMLFLIVITQGGSNAFIYFQF
jgi:alginate O-acetyltransferase complex protein AlgI